jgi:hypothetical protein
MKRFRAGFWAATVVVALGCGSQGLQVGPVPVSVPLEGGAIDPSAFILLPTLELTFTTTQDFCDLPSEQDVIDRLPDLGGIDMARFVELDSIDLAGIVLTASSGDFEFLREITVSYVPKPVNGLPQEPIVVGYAQSDNGFGDTVALEAPDYVDLLELIRDNDANSEPGCPQLEITVTGTRPDETVTWDGQVEADIYATLGR